MKENHIAVYHGGFKKMIALQESVERTSLITSAITKNLFETIALMIIKYLRFSTVYSNVKPSATILIMLTLNAETTSMQN